MLKITFYNVTDLLGRLKMYGKHPPHTSGQSGVWWWGGGGGGVARASDKTPYQCLPGANRFKKVTKIGEVLLALIIIN